MKTEYVNNFTKYMKSYREKSVALCTSMADNDIEGVREGIFVLMDELKVLYEAYRYARDYRDDEYVEEMLEDMENV